MELREHPQHCSLSFLRSAAVGMGISCLAGISTTSPLVHQGLELQ